MDFAASFINFEESKFDSMSFLSSEMSTEIQLVDSCTDNMESDSCLSFIVRYPVLSPKMSSLYVSVLGNLHQLLPNRNYFMVFQSSKPVFLDSLKSCGTPAGTSTAPAAQTNTFTLRSQKIPEIGP